MTWWLPPEQCYLGKLPSWGYLPQQSLPLCLPLSLSLPPLPWSPELCKPTAWETLPPGYPRHLKLTISKTTYIFPSSESATLLSPLIHEQESPTIHLLPTLETQSPWLLFLHHSASHQFCLYDDKTASWNQQFLSVPLLTTATMTNPFLSISLTTLTWTSPVPFHSASDHISMLPHNPQNKNQFLNKTDRVLPVFWLLSPWLPQLRLPL